MSVFDCGQDRDGGEQPNAEVDDGDAKLHRLAFLLTGDRHQPALGLGDEVVAELAGSGPAAAVSADGAPHHLWRMFGVPGVVESPPV